MPSTTNREYRDMIIEVRTAETEEAPDERMIVTGYASTFNEPYTLYENDDWRFNEVVDARAFDNTDMSDVIMQYDHEGRVFARMSNNTLTVTPDERGLLIEADLGGTELGRQLYEEIRGGYTNKMSFGFTVDGEDILDTKAEDGKALTVRTITSVRKLYDVSAVSLPANDATSISVRNLTDGEIGRIQAERLEAEALELRRRKLLVKAKLNGGQK
ncbi:MAG: HK97 family phage prohead protease [Clostridiales bacterium]|nr:HK97 family phage prohead protease [Clostridiales bacterium]